MSYICVECINDESLRSIIEDSVDDVQCNYCKQQGRGISIEQLAGIVDKYLREYLRIGDYPYRDAEQEGELLEYVLQDELGIDDNPAHDLMLMLEDSNVADLRNGDRPFYSGGESYLRCGRSSQEYHRAWEEFTNRIKHQARFFDDTARAQLAAILGERNSAEAIDLPFIEVGPGANIELLYRARLADSEKHATEILSKAAVELNSPCPTIATAGRMNPAGVSVFYGALSKDTAIAEVRPFVGSFVAVGCFKPLQKLKLLNLPRINSGITGSIFHPDYENRVARSNFFEMFHSLIAKPIQPREEALEYIPTQAVAEYVGNVLDFDGILYASAQVGAVSGSSEPNWGGMSKAELDQYNVVLFKGIELSFQPDSGYMSRVEGVKYSSIELRSLEGWN